MFITLTFYISWAPRSFLFLLFFSWLSLQFALPKSVSLIDFSKISCDHRIFLSLIKVGEWFRRYIWDGVKGGSWAITRRFPTVKFNMGKEIKACVSDITTENGITSCEWSTEKLVERLQTPKKKKPPKFVFHALTLSFLGHCNYEIFYILTVNCSIFFSG